MSNHSSRKALDLPLREIPYSENQQQFSFDITLNGMANQASQHSGSIKSVLIRPKEESNRSKDEVQTKRTGSSKGTANKENKKQVEIPQLSYLHLSRTLEQKCSLIAKQKEEIEVLKQCVQDIRNNKEFKTTEEERRNNAEILRLKQQEKEYLDNLREIDILKNNIREVRRKYEGMANEKNLTNQRYNKLLKENEELTVVISNLKDEVELRSNCPRNIELEENISQLQQELRKQQIQKQAVEERCCNFEKRMNEYVLKYNELQENCNEYQIKYYRLQKDCDNLRVDKEEAETQRNNVTKQLKSERNIHEEEQNKMKGKVRKLEEEKARLEESIISLKQTERRRYCDNEQLERLSAEAEKLKSQNSQLKDEISFQTRKWEKYIKEVMKQCGQEKQQMKDQHAISLSSKEEEIARLTSELSKLQEKESQMREQTSRQISYLKHTVQEKEEQLKEKTNTYEQLTSKCSQLADQHMRINEHYKIQLIQSQEKSKSYQKQLESANQIINELQNQIDHKNKQQDLIQDKIDELERQIQQGNDFLKYQTDALKAENDSLHEQLNSSHVKQKQADIKLEQLSMEVMRISELFKKKEDELAQNMKEVQAAYELIKRVRADQGKQKRYYQEKYENQLQEYNNLSNYYTQIESQHASLLKQHTECVLEISNLKAEVSQQTQISKGDWEGRILELCGQIEQLIAKVNQKEATIKEMDIKMANLIMERDHHKVLSQRNEQRLKEMDIEIRLQTERSQEKDRIISRIKSELEIQVQQIQKLSFNLQQTEIKYQSLSDRYNAELANWQIQKQDFQIQWRQYQSANQEERQELEYSRMNFSLSFDNSQTTIEILRRENEELQRIFGCEIERRNSIIRQLIAQKKQLYDQLASRSN